MNHPIQAKIQRSLRCSIEQGQSWLTWNGSYAETLGCSKKIEVE
jgi:hypothetical protein